MLERLQLKNFKAWKNTGDVSLKPVTMLLGTNSSGKSTLIQSLLLLKQTVQSPDRTVQLNLGGDEVNDFFNFGEFENVLKQGASSNQFEIQFSYKRIGKDERIKNGQFRAKYGQVTSGAVAIQSMELKTSIDEQEFSYRAERNNTGAYDLFVNQKRKSLRPRRDFVPERSIALSAYAIQTLGKDGPRIEDLSLAVRRELEGLIYLGPLRRKPERDYVWNKSKPGEIGIDGHKAIDVLLASALLRSDERNVTLDSVSAWLKKMKVADKLEVRQIGRSSRYEVVVHKNDVVANLRDVGIGVSQVLPVLTVAFFAPEGSTVLLEEPEIHLHPLAQSILAELFVTVSKKRRIQFIVETHSEHLFRRLQTLIAKQTTSTEKCNMYFVEKGRQAAKLRELTFDPYGRLSNWPEGFFGDALGETREQARLMFQRQKRNNS